VRRLNPLLHKLNTCNEKYLLYHLRWQCMQKKGESVQLANATVKIHWFPQNIFLNIWKYLLFLELYLSSGPHKQTISWLQIVIFNQIIRTIVCFKSVSYVLEDWGWYMIADSCLVQIFCFCDSEKIWTLKKKVKCILAGHDRTLLSS